MNRKRFRVAVRVGETLFDSLYCSFPFGKVEIDGDTLLVSSPIHGKIAIDRAEVVSFEMRRSLFNRFVRIHHVKAGLAKLVDVYCFRMNALVSMLKDWKKDGSQASVRTRVALLSIAVVLCLILAGCLAHPKYLESEYLWHREIDVVEDATNVCITVRGLCGHSALGVEPAEMSMDGDVLVAEIPLRSRGSGTICETIDVPSRVNKVKLAGDIIWERDR